MAVRHNPPHTPREDARRKLCRHTYPHQADVLERKSFLANDLTFMITAMEMLTVILDALGGFVQFSDGKESKSLW